MNKQYSELFDAYFDKATDTWLDSKCDDPECNYCTTRPEKPSQGPEYEKTN